MIHCADCTHALADLYDDTVDLVITDPPYSQHVHSKSRRGCTGYVEPTRPNAKAAQFNRTRELGFEHLTDKMRALCAKHFARLAMRWVLVFTDGESNHLWRRDLEAAGLRYVRTLYWEKLGATPQFTGDRPADHVEHIVLAHSMGKRKGRMTWNGGGRGNVYRYPIVQNRGGGLDGKRLHTTQKPLALMEALVRDFSQPGELILDPFAGSGTTLVAAARNGREAFGYEIDSVYAAEAQKRLETTVVQSAFEF
jgi:16S rRNA G966 N2-methylase RsmD